MNEIRIDDKEVIVMNLVHYFVTEKNYNPVVVHGINDEIWLENMESDFRIVRIISRYIHNDEQLGFNRFRSKQITKKLRIKTLSFKMPVLSIYVNLGENVKTLEDDDNGNLSVFISNIKDFKNNLNLLEVFPDIAEKTYHDEKGIELLFKITEDINQTNEKKNKKMEKIFSAKKPIFTYIIMGLCLIMFIASGMGDRGNSVMALGENVGEYVKAGQVYRLITCMFLHYGLIHFGFNMYALYVVGPRVEDFFGKWKFLAIYFLSGLSASLLVSGLESNVAHAGASGALFGLLGALLYFGYNYRGYIGAMVKSQIIPVIIYNLLLGFIFPQIGTLAHIGGLIGGILVANMVGTIENKKYHFNNIMPFLIYFIFLIYLGIFR